MNVKVEGGSTFGNVYVLPYIHCLLSERDGRWGGGGRWYTVLQISSDGHDRMGPLFHVTFTWQLRPLLAWQKFIKDLLR